MVLLVRFRRGNSCLLVLSAFGHPSFTDRKLFSPFFSRSFGSTRKNPTYKLLSLVSSYFLVRGFAYPALFELTYFSKASLCAACKNVDGIAGKWVGKQGKNRVVTEQSENREKDDEHPRRRMWTTVGRIICSSGKRTATAIRGSGFSVERLIFQRETVVF